MNDLKVQKQLYMSSCLSVSLLGSLSEFKVFLQKCHGVSNKFQGIKLNLISKKFFTQANKKTKPRNKYSCHMICFFTRHLKERLFKYNSYFLDNNGICQRGAMVHALGLFRSYAEKMTGLVCHLFIICCALI